MMETIKIAYLVGVPLLLVISLSGGSIKKYAIDLLAVFNILLIVHSFFLARQLIGLYELKNTFTHYYAFAQHFSVKAFAVVLLPLLALLPGLRSNRVFSMVMVAAFYSLYPFDTWNTYDLWLRVPVFFSLLCTAYALLWLLGKLPSQKRIA